MKKEIPCSRDSLSRKIQRLLSCHFLLDLFGGSRQEKEGPENCSRKCEYINGRNDHFLASCNVRPLAIPEILAQTQGFDYWQLIH